MEKREFGAVLYLYNGEAQPEILTVTSEDEALHWAGQFERTRVEQPGKPPTWLKPKKRFNDNADGVPADDAIPELMRSPEGSDTTEPAVDRLGPSFIGSSIFYDGWKTRK